MIYKRAMIFLCAVLVLQAIPSRGATGTWEDQYLSHSKKMILAGWVTFTSAYLLGLAAGIPLLGVWGPCATSQHYSENCGMGKAIYSGIMVIPTAGPAAVALQIAGCLSVNSA